MHALALMHAWRMAAGSSRSFSRCSSALRPSLVMGSEGARVDFAAARGGVSVAGNNLESLTCSSRSWAHHASGQNAARPAAAAGGQHAGGKARSDQRACTYLCNLSRGNTILTRGRVLEKRRKKKRNRENGKEITKHMLWLVYLPNP